MRQIGIANALMALLLLVSSTATVGIFGRSPVLAQTDFSQTTLQGWFNGTGTCSQIPLTITNDDKPPQVTLSKGQANCNVSGYTGPNLVFKLSEAHSTYTEYTKAGGVVGPIGAGIGSVAGSNVIWTIFQAHLADGTLVPNLYLIGDNRGQNWTVRYASSGETLDTNSVPTEENYLTMVMIDDGESSDSLPTNTYQALYRYLLDGPSSGDNCVDGNTTKTGPNQTPPTLTVTGGKLSELNSNCLDTSATGWAVKWGVKTINNTLKAGQCGIAGMFNGDLGNAFNNLINCLFTQVFQPIISWAADLVTKAAGVSVVPDRHRYALISKEWRG